VNKTVEAVNLGAADYVTEPFDGRDILAILDRIREKADLRRQTYRLEKQLAEKYVFEGMVGRSAVMLELFSLIERLAKFSSPVLIQGATGTGKEMVARALHRLSPRRERKLVVCDCTSIPESLFESELFGYERGRSPGPTRRSPAFSRTATEGPCSWTKSGTSLRPSRRSFFGFWRSTGSGLWARMLISRSMSG
jgi:Response regulator containing CheY-like receiver, AAA-type ATPase, and DNA-binding domains